MKEFYIYKMYMFLFEILRITIMLIFGIITFLLLPSIFSSTINTIIFFIVFIMIIMFSFYYIHIIKGKIGEYITQKVIESYCNKRGYSYLYDIMVKNEIVETSQIDHLIITKKGIAVIETKYHKGTIYGSEYAKEWTYITRDDNNKKHKNRYSNPIKQNYGHIQALKKILDKEVEFYNVVLYIDNVNLKKCKISNKFTRVGYTYNLNEIIEELDTLSETTISKIEAYEIYNKFKYLNIIDKKERKEHVKRIRDTYIKERI